MRVTFCGAAGEVTGSGYLWSRAALEDAARIQVAEAERLNRSLERRGNPPVEPLYTLEDVQKPQRRFQGLPYTFGPSSCFFAQS